MTRHPRPGKFDYNLVVIGAGSAGLVASYIAAAVRARVALVEKHKMGGDCLNTGCVPSKALIRTTKMLGYARRAGDFGLNRSEVDFDFATVMERVRQVISKIEPHDSVERYRRLGVDCFAGEARITSPCTVTVNDRTLTTRSIVIATGASPVVPPIPGLERMDYLTSDNLWDLREKPERLVVLGGGPIGSELSQAFARLGCRVTQVEMAPRLLMREDPEVGEFLRHHFESEGVRVLTGHTARKVEKREGGNILCCEHAGVNVEVPFDRILIAVGRRPNVSGFGLENIGVHIAATGTIETDPFLRTNIPGIYCAGDAAGPYQFTHTAGHQAWYAAVNALFGGFKSFAVDDRVIPWCTFTDPEVARVGLSEEEARHRQIPHEITRFSFEDLDRAIADSEVHGWIKILTVPGRDKILGVTIVGPHAGDLLAEYVLAMKHGLGLSKILATIHVYPTLADAGKLAAGAWKREHAPQKLLSWLERFHAWRRH